MVESGKPAEAAVVATYGNSDLYINSLKVSSSQSYLDIVHKLVLG